MNFDLFKAFIDKINNNELYRSINPRLGIFSLFINNNGKIYYFDNLKIIMSFNEDICGFSLNHSYQQQRYKKSKFHDSEDICVDIIRNEFISCERISDRRLLLKTKNWNSIISW